MCASLGQIGSGEFFSRLVFSQRRSHLCAPSIGLSFVEQFLEQRSIVDHGLAQVFRTGLSSAVAQRNRMRGTIAFDHRRMIYGYVAGTLLEIANGITAGLHRVGDKAVSLSDGAFWIVNEAALNIIPAIEKARAISRG